MKYTRTHTFCKAAKSMKCRKHLRRQKDTGWVFHFNDAIMRTGLRQQNIEWLKHDHKPSLSALNNQWQYSAVPTAQKQTNKPKKKKKKPGVWGVVGNKIKERAREEDP